MTIRKAEERDIEAVCAITVAAWTPIYETYRRELGDEIFETFCSDWQSGKRASVTVAMRGERGYVTERDGRVVGFISYFADTRTKTGVIGENAVAPDCRGQGIAGAQYAFVFERMREEGLTGARVTTGLDESHAPARRAYGKAGFEAGMPSITYYRNL